jgi:phosphoesterase RecJ-like protein
MALYPKQQALQLIEYSNKILVVGHCNPDGDSLGSTMALYFILKKQGKDVTAASVGSIPEVYKFLPNLDVLASDFGESRDLVISIDNKESKVDKLSYNIKDDKLNIVIAPVSGSIDPKNIKFSKGSMAYDLIIVLDCSEPSQLNYLYQNNKDLFTENPVINIDHHPTNKYFGQVNVVDPEASSTAEILVSIIESLGPNLIDANIATYLLTGVIFDTWSFQNTNTTPKALTVAAQLCAAGARKEEIIRYVLKAKPVSTLRLWGRILGNIKEDKDQNIVWSKISYEDLQDSGVGDEAQTSALMNQFLGHALGADVVILLKEVEPQKVAGSFRTSKEGVINVAKLAKLLGGGGHPVAAGFMMEGKPLDEVETEVITRTKEYLVKETEKKAQTPEEKPQEIREEKEIEEEAETRKK